MSIDSKPKPSHRDESEDSAGSTPEGERNPITTAAIEPVQPKRKGGRKPIYATSEERKQRNRQAQAAFRERRTEYIKQLEEAIQVHETNLHNLQSAHRNAADECLMLRYKNSLLERILLEKGIDVHAELQAKTGSPTLGPTHMPQNMVQPPPLQRPIMNRARKSVSTLAPKLDANNSAMTSIKPETSPKAHPTPSPSNSGSTFSPVTENTGIKANSLTGSRHQMPSIITSAPGQTPLMERRSSSLVSPGGAFYPTPAFHNHLDSLEQHEYDHHGDMMQDSELDHGAVNEPFHTSFAGGEGMMPPPTSAAGSHHVPGSGPGFSMSQLLDQNMDWDPFGLSASMNFPTQQFSFDHSAPLR
ncbi:bZIP transcription factor, bZIP-1 [Cordyceps fumosorosea ARSEF 2679]|uniref:BZIP transcription factor, bZIP-1 n=1 Tax=Cordyceps fumosorosea (strain ARSEF 2679) TaxID=1081104 RepID=A0A167PA60_CORFA|nr:bZIP transcription factor, bZIP-1 [Cordyceps fumosorosea ARSEF 2679]OAA56449.1 bZIP transcription factor, bZIP-1 [Cordyceps fumosorosea ARSEF 2679]